MASLLLKISLLEASLVSSVHYSDGQPVARKEEKKFSRSSETKPGIGRWTTVMAS